uniref:Isopenicillin N synthase-like Fe(2+) 2OG dioxygenase domain-containing protein n=1 Tax=Oryza punctata TaxID=4537 RepID=A0A0E0LTI4_ORYPU
MASQRSFLIGVMEVLVDDMDWEDIFYLHDDNQWPSNPPEFKETMPRERVMEAMDENLGLDKGRMKRALTGDDRHAPFFGTKVSHYPPCPRPHRCRQRHPADDRVGGLQVLKGRGWVDMQPLANAIVINTGDQVEVLSNGRYRSGWHRVLPMRDGNRRSVASFYNLAFEATISLAVACCCRR